MDLYCVMGNPVEHSKSPWIHARFAELTGQTLQYGKRLIPLDGFALAVHAFIREGGRGCNITVPFKFEAAALGACRTLGIESENRPQRGQFVPDLQGHSSTMGQKDGAKWAAAVGSEPMLPKSDRLLTSHASERATLAQACNVLSFSNGNIFADNTDGSGLVNDIQRNAGLDLSGRRLLLIGAGGAAAGVLGPLIRARPASITVANRTLNKASALVARHSALALLEKTELFARDLQGPGRSFDVVINASASSLSGAGVPVPASTLKPGALAYDMMYGPAAQGFLNWARAHGATPRDGLGMLVEQAAEAFLIWRGVLPPAQQVLAELRTVMVKRDRHTS